MENSLILCSTQSLLESFNRVKATEEAAIERKYGSMDPVERFRAERSAAAGKAVWAERKDRAGKEVHNQHIHVLPGLMKFVLRTRRPNKKILMHLSSPMLWYVLANVDTLRQISSDTMIRHSKDSRANARTLSNCPSVRLLQ